ncbi:hypothetical protein GKE82_01150 [Conexibacter sp. W3-3-2]|uniref:hypothetical protein n=1 Tax=Conexibacter sp. W3-3-2 TaxID=2675227 RepID=UPI0012B95471|nr:hypothetical protein [Conexibacter sp. W3-3-2]MTD42945.1 hypothetical protein [Conexibacter sp. W3-3-2]
MDPPSSAGSRVSAVPVTGRDTDASSPALRLGFDVDERVTAVVRLSRAGRTIAKRTVTLAPGSRALDLLVPAKTAGGSARLTVSFTDTDGARNVVTRTVTVPRRDA